jgi:hypothetical protein
MPPLSKALRGESPKGYVAQEQLPASVPTPKEPGQVRGANPFIRCPLPPFNATSDTLRQFNEDGKIPARRVIPLPISTVAGGNTAITNNTTVNNSGGGSSGNIPVVVAAKTVTFSPGTILPGDAAVLTVTVAEIVVLMLMGSSDLGEVRIYGDPITQAADVARVTDTAPAFEVTQGLVTDVVFDTSPFQFNWQNRLFVNQDAPQTTNMYITVVNSTGAAINPDITITYLQLE